MAAHPLAEECEKLTRSFSGLGGLGVDENSLVSIIAKWRHQPDNKSHFRRSFSNFFKHDGSFERCEDDYVLHLKTEFARFKNTMVLWAMHPWERDARWAHHVLKKARPFSILVEISCTRSSEDLLGARKAYHALYHSSLEEDVAYHINEYSNLLVGLVSAYRYEGSKVNDDMAKSEAKILGKAIKNANTDKLLDNTEVIRILTTRSKPHLQMTFKYYKEMHGNPIDEDLGDDLCLQETVQCLESPATYYSKVIHNAFKDDGNKITKEALTRVIVSRAHEDMDQIREVYQKQYGDKLEDMVAKNTYGNYKDALLSMIGSN